MAGLASPIAKLTPTTLARMFLRMVFMVFPPGRDCDRMDAVGVKGA
jgi:hypothetical protein